MSLKNEQKVTRYPFFSDVFGCGTEKSLVAINQASTMRW
jgi:hypothetical protein